MATERAEKQVSPSEKAWPFCALVSFNKGNIGLNTWMKWIMRVCVCVCQEVLRSLHQSQNLLQRQTEALSRVEQELRKLREEYQVRLPKTQLHQQYHFQLNTHTKKQLLLLWHFFILICTFYYYYYVFYRLQPQTGFSYNSHINYVIK